MSTRGQVSAWIAAVVLLLPSMARGQARTERDLIELIVRQGPQALAIRAEADVVREEGRARLAYPNPAISYSREGAGFTEFLQAEQQLPIFGIRAVLARAGVAATAAAEAERTARLWLLRSEAATAVVRLGAEMQRSASAESLVGNLERVVEILRTREREGEGSRLDRMRADQELRDAQQTLTTAAVAVALARQSIAGMLPADVSFEGIAVDRSARQPFPALETLTARADAARAELRALRQSRQLATIEAEAARRARLPAPTVFGGVKRADVDTGRVAGSVFGVNVSVPLFDDGRLEAARWMAEGSRLEAERTAVERRIRAEVAAAGAVLALRERAAAPEEDAGGDALAQIAEVAYREGESGILEWLDAVRVVSRARLRTIDVELDRRLAQIALERAVGEVLWP